MKKRILSSVFVLTLICTLAVPDLVQAYSYGDPGEEALAEAYKELQNYVEQDDWDNARTVYDTYEKEFGLYFNNTIPFIEEAFKNKDKELLLESYQAALRLNIERRLHFAEDQFEDYGQAKLLLAKARGTFNVLQPIVEEEKGKELVDRIYQSFDQALVSLGNPGLFGIGNQDSDGETFTKEVNFIIGELQSLFPVPSENEDDSHLVEENLDFLNLGGEEGNSSFWLWFTLILTVVLVLIIVIQRRKKKDLD